MTVARLGTDPHTTGTFCQALLESWKLHEIEFVVLRNCSTLPRIVGNDIDVLVRASTLPKAEALLVECGNQCGLKLCNRVAFQPLSLFLADPQSAEHVHLGLFHNLTWRGFRLLSADEVLALKRRRDAFWIPHPVHEAILNLVNHLLYRGTIRAKYKQKIDDMLSAERDFSLACLTDMFGAGLAEQLMEMVSRADWGSIEKRSYKLRLRLVVRRLAFAPAETVRNLVADAWRLARRFARPPGLAIALLGPDGAGKSTVAEALPSAGSGTCVGLPGAARSTSLRSGRQDRWHSRWIRIPLGRRWRTPRSWRQEDRDV